LESGGEISAEQLPLTPDAWLFVRKMPDMSDAEVSKRQEEVLWRSYLATRDPIIRTQLFELYRDTAHKLAAYYYARRPDRGAEFADYMQYACIGLIESLDRYNPEGDASFPTFASYRIRGAILNGLERSTELAAQHAYRRQVEKERVDSLVEESKSTTDPFEGLVSIAIEMALGFALEDSGLATNELGTDPYRTLALKDLRDRLLLIVEALPERERQIVKWHYFDHLEFKTIGEVFELSRGRVSQLHSRALKLIREGLRSIDRFDLSV
jgi:RNA polymerase sigma factor FliA